MSAQETDRFSLLRDLLNLSEPLERTTQFLAQLDWDYAGEGVILSKAQLSNVLQRYLRGELSESEVGAWANQIEGREDVRCDPAFEDVIEDALYELANPDLTEPLTRHSATRLLANL